jgi:hypothetical protein
MKQSIYEGSIPEVNCIKFILFEGSTPEKRTPKQKIKLQPIVFYWPQLYFEAYYFNALLK